MAFTEFYISTLGSNLNSGSSNSTNAQFTSTNGNWQAGGIANFRIRDAQNPTGNVNVGDFASIYNDGAAEAVYIVRITAVQNATNGNISVSLGNSAGTAPTNATSGRTIKVGGAWKGPTNA